MSSEPAIRVEGLGKRYLIRHQTASRYTALRDVISDGARDLGRRALRRPVSPSPNRELIWALRHLSFELGEGERLGVIGRNGAGKSTLLKVLSRITEPTEGRVWVRGRVGSLLEVGTGFHPELTGRENIFLNGTILGMSRHEVRRKFDEIVAFAEVERFLDTPVKRYSSGMYVRLAFAVAAHLEPEILIVDEVLAVGDAAFQRKCLGKMSDVAASGRTVILVSHNMAAIQQLCTRSIWLHDGTLQAIGPTADVVAAYAESYSGSAGGEFSARGVQGDGKVRLLSYEVLNRDRRATPLPVTGEDLVIRVRVEALEPISQPACGISLWTATGVLLTSLNSVQLGVELAPWPAGEIEIDVVVRDVDYLPGPYKADFWVMTPQGQLHAHAEDAITFDIGETQIYGTSQVDQRWGCVFSDIAFVPRVGESAAATGAAATGTEPA
jgi:lipopolysaccharide transport system ATP-binding protein